MTAKIKIEVFGLWDTAPASGCACGDDCGPECGTGPTMGDERAFSPSHAVGSTFGREGCAGAGSFAGNGPPGVGMSIMRNN